MKPRHQNFWIGMAMLLSVRATLGQGTVAFNNFGGNGSAVAPIYGSEPENPHFQIWGNTADADPPGMQTYSGPLVAGTNYSVQGWSSTNPVPNVFSLDTSSSPIAGSLTTFLEGEVAGFFNAPSLVILWPDWFFSPDYGPGMYMQVRAWDNAGGEYATWDEAWNAASAGSGNALGWSKVFWQPVAFGGAPAAGLYNFESFNIFIVPEPSAFALVGLGGLIVLYRRAKVKTPK